MSLMLCFSASVASEESSMSLLDNRFRVDPTIKQITFVIYREQSSKPVVLVRPDGKKYYAWRSPDNVQWYQESSLDIISIDDPMPGPWQAVGKVTPKNRILLISHLALESDTFPTRLYQGEEIKFTAKLTSDGEPLILRDFLDRISLKVTFTKFVENEQDLISEAKPVPEVLGVFSDDGTGLDEFPGDGIFTVALPISSQPGKYRVRITSGNGIFLRAQEQEVLVYPTPIQHTFIQSRDAETAHQIILSGEQGMVKPGSLAAQIDHTNSDGELTSVSGSAIEESEKLDLWIPNSDKVGHYQWQGKVFATDMATGRPLAFMVTDQSYNILEEIDFEKTRLIQEEQQRKQQQLLEELRIKEEKEAARTRSMIIIGVGNIVAILVGLAVWFIRRKLNAAKKALPEMQLDMPKK
ncbi:TIGR03503 family protein [Vibrio genomosp. F10]|uniref:TIGR03503 family protein n=1 Tax=Vibrio genomosp. F10 TaxID=723171 RepID=A0A1B9R0Z9_9VIBR|nr:TIGR03503 family protein [Vibrio genomosp. F10]OCH77969.1 TIGR03503 family protein [Vibrio genomosp. F10]OEE93320.1 TIGR03503 family protein [Vibrio genomosp. F10 str. 9ZC157]